MEQETNNNEKIIVEEVLTSSSSINENNELKNNEQKPNILLNDNSQNNNNKKLNIQRETDVLSEENPQKKRKLENFNNLAYPQNINNNNNNNYQNNSNSHHSFRYITPELELNQIYKTKDLRSDRNLQDQITQECYRALREKNPLLATITNIKIVCNPRKNFINMIVKQDYQDMVFHKSDQTKENHCCFFLSNKFEPYVIVIILNNSLGRLTYLDQNCFQLLQSAIHEFKHHHQLSGEGYYYTATKERHNEAKGFQAKNRSHSHDFHMKIRISTQMLVDKMAIYQIVNLQSIRRELEVLRYQFEGRELLSYDAVMKIIQNDFDL